MNGNETGTVEYLTELAFNSNLPNLIVFNVAFYMHLIRQFDSLHVKCDVYVTIHLTIYYKLPKTKVSTCNGQWLNEPSIAVHDNLVPYFC